jgi:hypothetical protein
MSNMTPPTPGPGALPPKSGLPGWMKYGLIGCGGLMIVFAIVSFAGFYFVKSKVKQAGFDTDLLQKNPAMAVTKMITAFNPDLEVVNVDDSRGIITVHDKKQNKTLTINLEDAKKGKLVFQEAGKDAVTLETHGDGAAGTMDIKSADGTVHIGAGGKAPAWIPAYPGATPEGSFASSGGKGDAGAFHFKTRDSVQKVADFYAAELQKAGFKVTTNVANENGKATGGVIGGADEANKRHVNAMVSADGDGTGVSVTYETKK